MTPPDGISTKPTAQRPEASSPPAASFSGEGLVIWALWMTYGAFYFGRTNIAAAVPGIKDDLGYTQAEIGLVLGSLKLAYGIGQLVNGQLAEQVSPRRLLAVGMLGSAFLNVLFGFGTGLYFLLFVWACNGYAQSLGWTPCMRVAANWVDALRRGRVIGVLGTSYQVCGALTYVLAGFSAQLLGWRGALYVPAALLAAAALHMLVFLREAPRERDPRLFPGDGAVRGRSKGRWLDNLLITVSNPALWFMGLALGFLDFCRYGFQDWGITHLMAAQPETGVGKAALQYAVLPLGGAAGALASGWATDRVFGGRRAPVILVLLVLLGLLALVYDGVARASFPATVLLLGVVGFCIFGPQVLLVGTAPADLARRGTAAAAAGFVNFMGYMGAFAGDRVTGKLADDYGWPTAVVVWAGCAFAAAAMAACLWALTPRTQETTP